MRHNDILTTLQSLTERKPKQRELAEAMDVNINVISNRAVRNTKYSLDELIKISNYFSVDLISFSDYSENMPADIKIDIPEVTDDSLNDDNLQGKSFNIPYWQGINEEITSRIKDDEITEFCLDMQFIVKKLKCKPEDLRIISMTGDDMDGGTYPIRNRDILLIDISRNNVYESGIFFCTTHGGTRLYVRRIFERMTDSTRYYTTIDNEIYKKEVEKFWTVEKWKEADVQIVGRVIQNMSYVI